MRTLTKHYIDGAFVESHGQEVMDIISPTSGKAIGYVTLGDEDDTRRAIAAAVGRPEHLRLWEAYGWTGAEPDEPRPNAGHHVLVDRAAALWQLPPGARALE